MASSSFCLSSFKGIDSFSCLKLMLLLFGIFRRLFLLNLHKQAYQQHIEINFCVGYCCGILLKMIRKMNTFINRRIQLEILPFPAIQSHKQNDFTIFMTTSSYLLPLRTILSWSASPSVELLNSDSLFSDSLTPEGY